AGGADAAFEAEADHAGPAPDAAFVDGAGAGVFERSVDVFAGNVESANIVEMLIVALGDDGYQHPVVVAQFRVLVGEVAADRVVGQADAHRIGEHDWRVNPPQFLNLAARSHLARAR